MSSALTHTTRGTSANTAPQVAPKLRITARGRAVVTGLVALPFVAIIGVLVLNGGGAVATGESARALESVTVMA